jgi:hypothetical protein
MAEWGHKYGTRIAQALGFTHNTPCAATLHTVFRHGDRDPLEAQLGAWAEQVVVSLPPAPSAGEAAIALAGKTLRGSRKQGAPGAGPFSSHFYPHCIKGAGGISGRLPQANPPSPPFAKGGMEPMH